MSITGTGYLIIIVTLYAVLNNRKFLYDFTIFSIPFSSTAVINFGAEGGGTSVQPYMFLSTIWLMGLVISRVKKVSVMTINRKELVAICFLLVFALVTLISLVMPIIINGSDKSNPTGHLEQYEPILFSFRNVTQYFYLLHGIIFAIGIYLYNKDKGNYLHTVRVYFWAVIFTVCWGWLELALYYAHITYPSFLFNNSFNPNAGGFDALMAEDSIKRISSVALEPSILVQSVIIIIPFIIFGVIKWRSVHSKKINAFLVLLLSVFIIRSTSTGGIVGLIFLTMLSLYYYFKQLNRKKRVIFLISVAVIVPIFTMIIYFLFQNIITQMLFNKSDTYSSLERGGALIDAWGDFIRHPILGTGWGSVGSFDLFVKILSNTGVLGCFFFTVFLILVFKNLALKNYQMDKTAPIKISIIITFATLIFGNAINGFAFFSGYFWFVTGLAIVSTYKHNENISYNGQLSA